MKTSFFQQGNQCTISDDERRVCEGLLTARECLESLKNRESKKTPGTDGIPVKFYKVFWNDIKPFSSPLLTLLMLKAFSPYHRGEDY